MSEPKKSAKKPKAPAKFTPSQFRLGPEVLGDMDLIASDREAETGVPHTRTDVLRYLVKKDADRIRKKKSDG